jgi:hypothetical protein
MYVYSFLREEFPSLYFSRVTGWLCKPRNLIFFFIFLSGQFCLPGSGSITRPDQIPMPIAQLNPEEDPETLTIIYKNSTVKAGNVVTFFAQNNFFLRILCR